MALTGLTPLVVDTTGEVGTEDRCDHAVLMGSYNWRTGGFNFERCRLKIGHKGPHEAHLNNTTSGKEFVLGRIQWTDEMGDIHDTDGDLWNVARFWERVDKERAK